MRLRHAALAAIIGYGSSSCSHWYGQSFAYTATAAGTASLVALPFYSDSTIDTGEYEEFILITAAVVALIAIPYTIHDEHKEQEALAAIEESHKDGGGGGDNWQPTKTDACGRCLETCDHEFGQCLGRCKPNADGDADSSCNFRCEQDDTQCGNHCDGTYSSDHGQRACIPSHAAEEDQPGEPPAAAIPDVTFCGDAASSEPALSGNDVISSTGGWYDDDSAAAACAGAKNGAFTNMLGRQTGRGELRQYVVYATCCSCHRELNTWHCTAPGSGLPSGDGDREYASFGAGTSSANEEDARQAALRQARHWCQGTVASEYIFGCISDHRMILGGREWACFAAAKCNY
jgi:hypothetical protein